MSKTQCFAQFSLKQRKCSERAAVPNGVRHRTGPWSIGTPRVVRLGTQVHHRSVRQATVSVLYGGTTVYGGQQCRDCTEGQQCTAGRYSVGTVRKDSSVRQCTESVCTAVYSVRQCTVSVYNVGTVQRQCTKSEYNVGTVPVP